MHAFTRDQWSGLSSLLLCKFTSTHNVWKIAKKSPQKGSLPWRPIQGGGIRLVRGWAVSTCRHRRKSPGGGHHPRSSGWGPEWSHWSTYRRPVPIKVYGIIVMVWTLYSPSASTSRRQIAKVGRSHRTERLPVLQSGCHVRAKGGGPWWVVIFNKEGSVGTDTLVLWFQLTTSAAVTRAINVSWVFTRILGRHLVLLEDGRVA